MTTLRLTWTPLWLPGIALVLAMVLFAAEAPTAARQTNAALAAVGVLLTWGVAVAIRLRDPDRPMATLLFVLAAVLAMHPALGGSSNPYLFVLGRSARMVSELVLVWVMLAFPSGRLTGVADRFLLAGLAAAVLLLWLPSNFFSLQIPIRGPVLLCEGDCPPNVLFVIDWPEAAQALIAAFRAVVVALLLGVMARLLRRWSRATPLRRRVLAPVQIVFVLRTLSLMLVVASDRLGWVPVLMFGAVPVAMAYGLLAGRLWIARALQQLVSGLRSMPSRHELQPMIARALGDASLQIGYWVPDLAVWVDADGRVLPLPPAGDTQRAAQVINGERGEAVAVLVHDAALLEEPTLVESVASSMRVALASQQLEAAVRSSSQAAAQAAAGERERIERDLHDGAQQRLIALRMKLAVVQRLLEQDPARAAALLGETGPDIEAALRELRDLAHGVTPGLLVQEGLASALAQLAQRQPFPVTTRIEDVGRFAAGVEHAVYFCCAEALQNAAKHGGGQVRIELTLALHGKRLVFCIGDDGPGLDKDTAVAGRGLANMRRRLDEIGATLQISDRPGGGVLVQGEVPADTTRTTSAYSRVVPGDPP